MSDQTYAIGIDVGGTKTRFGVVRIETMKLVDCLPESFSVQSQVLGEVTLRRHGGLLICSTPTLLLHPDKSVEQLQQALLEIVLTVVRELRVQYLSGKTVTTAGVSFAGLVNDNGVVTKAADLYFEWGEWTEAGVEKLATGSYAPFELQRLLNQELPDLHWQVINDVTAAACRYIHNEAFPVKHKSALLTISTGIGYVLMMPDRFFLETAKVVSLGHHVVDTSAVARTCDCGGVGHLTAYASGKAVEKRIREQALDALIEFRHSKLWQIVSQRLGEEASGQTDDAIAVQITAHDVALAIKQHDDFVQPLFLNVQSALAEAMAEVVAAGVESIILMGGFAQAVGHPLIDGLSTVLAKKYAWIKPTFFQLGYADDADGVIGVCRGMQIHANNHLGGMSRGVDEHGNSVISLDATTHHTTRVWYQNPFNSQQLDFKHCVSAFGPLTSKAFFVVETSLVSEYTKQIKMYCRAHNITYALTTITTSSASNSIKQLTRLLTRAKNFGLGRTDVFISVGTENTLKLVGMAAGMYRRGVAHISILKNDATVKSLVAQSMSLSFTNFALPVGCPFHPPTDVYIDQTTTTTINDYCVEQSEIDRFSVIQTESLWRPENNLFTAKVKQRPVAIVISYAADKLYGEKIRSYIKHHKIAASWWRFAAGEEGKYWKTAISFARKIARVCADGGDEVIVAIGGGVTMDVAGFAASLIGRPYLRVPTTLLGAIDAGVGVKVGVNFTNAKNFLGDFYSPETTLIDTEMLRTVSARNIRAGLAEIIKMGVIIAPRIVELLEQHTQQLVAERFQKDATYANEVIDLSIYWMMSELQRNLHEDHSLQRLVDFGHAFSPIIELRSHHQIIHGEAVAIDMAICAELAFRMKLCSQITRDRILNLLMEIGLMVWHPLCECEALYAAMNDIRLHRGGTLNLPLPTSIGQMCFVDSFEQSVLGESLDYLKELQKQTDEK